MGLLELVVLTPVQFLPPTLSYPLMPYIMLVKTSGHSLLFTFHCSVDGKTPYLALGAVKNISLNISISNLGDDAYDANVSFNVSRELFFINMWQKVRKAPLKRVFVPSGAFSDFHHSLQCAVILQRLFYYVGYHLEL